MKLIEDAEATQLVEQPDHDEQRYDKAARQSHDCPRSNPTHENFLLGVRHFALLGGRHSIKALDQNCTRMDFPMPAVAGQT